MTIDNRISTKSRQIGLELYFPLINIDKGFIENKKEKKGCYNSNSKTFS